MTTRPITVSKVLDEALDAYYVSRHQRRLGARAKDAFLAALRDAGWALVPADSLDAGLICAVCWFVKVGIANPAVTIIEGYAVCEDHQGYVAQGQNFASIVNAAKREET